MMVYSLMISPPSATTIIAVYGAVLSTLAIVRQLMDAQIKVKVTVSRDMQMNDPLYRGKALTIVKTTNHGRRPVTITTVVAINLYPHDNFVAVDHRPQLPCEITEGQYVTTILDQEGLDFSILDYWMAVDSRDKKYKLREASRFEHWKSLVRRKLAIS
jgi:hypothetical protein